MPSHRFCDPYFGRGVELSILWGAKAPGANG
jgi:hypothetical protein